MLLWQTSALYNVIPDFINHNKVKLVYVFVFFGAFHFSSSNLVLHSLFWLFFFQNFQMFWFHFYNNLHNFWQHGILTLPSKLLFQLFRNLSPIVSPSNKSQYFSLSNNPFASSKHLTLFFFFFFNYSIIIFSERIFPFWCTKPCKKSPRSAEAFLPGLISSPSNFSASDLSKFFAK